MDSIHAFTEADILRLPKWAASKIRDLTRERDAAVDALHAYADAQTIAPFFIDELESLGEKRGPSQVVRFVQTHKMAVRHKGVLLRIHLREEPHDRNCIQLQWGDDRDTTCSHIAAIPTSFQAIELYARENMR